MLLDVADAGRAVGLEQEGEKLPYPVGEYFAFLHIARTLGTGIELVSQAARAYLAPVRLVVLLASGTFPGQELAASSAVKAASGNVLRIGHDTAASTRICPSVLIGQGHTAALAEMLFHINRRLNACQLPIQAVIKM